MNIRSTQISPTLTLSQAQRNQAVANSPETSPQPPSDSFHASSVPSQDGRLQGPLGRAIYGAALYGLPAIAGATMGINGVVPGAVIGAGIGAATHLQSGSQAGIFAATGAAVGAAAGYVGFLGAAHGFKLPAVLITAAVGAGTQALFALTQEN